jgi:hypothetical protein
MRYGNLVALGVMAALATAVSPTTPAGANGPLPSPAGIGRRQDAAAAAPAAAMIPTKRSVAIARARTWLTAWHGGPVPYSQTQYLGGWRTDCSGYVSMAWNLRNANGTPLNHNTDSMLRGGYGTPGPVVHPIAWGDLRPADAIGFLGAGSIGDAGHVMLFEQWANSAHTAYWVFEQAGDGGTHHRVHPITYNHYKPYRYNKILEG